MPKNKIQFQQGLSLPKFLNSYGTEKQCENALYSMRWPQGIVCPDCGCSNYYELKTRKLYQCSACKRQMSLISGTIFEATKLQLTTWFLAIYLLTQSKDGISSLNLSRTLGISANAALRMKHKLQHKVDPFVKTKIPENKVVFFGTLSFFYGSFAGPGFSSEPRCWE